MQMFGSNDEIDQLPTKVSMRWCGHVLRWEDCHILRGMRVKGIPVMILMFGVHEECVGAGLG